MAELWVPGATGPSLEDFVKRIHRTIEEFAVRRGWDSAVVEITLHDGTTFSLYSMSPEPGYGLVTLCPYPEDEQRTWPTRGEDAPVPPEELMVPIGSIMRITLGQPEERTRFGFTLPSA